MYRESVISPHPCQPIISSFNDSHPRECEEVLHWGFVFAFWLLVILIIIWHACWSFVYLSGKKCIFKFFAHILTELFVFLLLSHGSSFHIMNAKSLLSIWTTNNFSHCVDCLLLSWLMGFDTQKFFNLDKGQLLFFFLFLKAYAFGVLWTPTVKFKIMTVCGCEQGEEAFVVITSTLAFLSTYTESKDQPEGKLRALLEYNMFPVLHLCGF